MADSTTEPENALVEMSFETALAKLETLVEKLEGGELSLEQSLREFEHGIQLARHCQNALQNAEQQVKVLMQEGGEAILRDLAADPQ